MSNATQDVLTNTCKSVNAIIGDAFDNTAEWTSLRPEIEGRVVQALENNDTWDPYEIALKSIDKFEAEVAEMLNDLREHIKTAHDPLK